MSCTLRPRQRLIKSSGNRPWKRSIGWNQRECFESFQRFPQREGVSGMLAALDPHCLGIEEAAMMPLQRKCQFLQHIDCSQYPSPLVIDGRVLAIRLFLAQQ